MDLNENYDGKTKLKDWWLIVKENFRKIVTAFNEEVQERETEDEKLSSRLSKVEKISDGIVNSSCLNNYEYKYDSNVDTKICIMN